VEATAKIDPIARGRPRAGSHVSLLFTWGENTQAVALREGQELVVGRAGPAQLVLDDHSLSRTHARLSLRHGRVTLEDLGSTNGCLLNGTRLNSSAVLSEEDLVQLGAVELRVCAQEPLPNQTDVLSHASFMRALSEELTRARVFGRALSVVAVRQTTLSVGSREQSREQSNEQLRHQALQRALRPVDRLCNFAPTLSLVLLPERDRVAARRWLEDVSWLQAGARQTAIASYPDLACTAEELVSRALDACHAAPLGGVHEAEATAATAQGPILRSPCMLRLYDLVARAARTTLPVLVQGETGTGKELVAQAVHEKSPHSKAPFKALNCATIPANLLESVLFGHERGAFTGAARQAEGVFEQAHGGTVFLDEVGELSAQAQAALLRVLEQRRIIRVGGTREIEVDARVVAATHRDLAAMVQAGTFREDLMFRLDALTLRVPPLRERTEEIVPLAELFLARAHAKWGASAARLSEDANDALTVYAWPGNVRQLKNVIERAVVVCTGEQIELEDLPAHVWKEPVSSPALVGVREPDIETARDGGAFRSLPDRLREFEIGIIREAMQRAHDNQSQAARILGLPRRTLVNKLHAYGIRQSS
jgi:DNA-binding NtrC family response regulator